MPLGSLLLGLLGAFYWGDGSAPSPSLSAQRPGFADGAKRATLGPDRAHGSKGGAAAHVPRLIFGICRGIFITGSSLVGAAVKVPRITSKNLIRFADHLSKLFRSPVSYTCICRSTPFRFILRSASAHSSCSVIFCEATAIYGVIVAIILQTKIEYVPQNADGTYPSAAVFSGYGVFGSGITVGFANLVCGCEMWPGAARTEHF